MIESIGQFKLPVQSTKDLFRPGTRMCHLVHGNTGAGKTRLGGTLDAFTKQYRGKPTLFIAMEPAEGGGSATNRDRDIAVVVPSTLAEVDGILDWLKTDKEFGGVVVDNMTDYVKNILQPFTIQNFPSREKSPTRQHGVADRGDYQSMGEFCRQRLQKLVNLTRTTNPEYRKDLVVLALTKEVQDQDTQSVSAIQPNLPGQMSQACGAMFQQVSYLAARATVVKITDAQGRTVSQRIHRRVLINDTDGVIVARDRWGILPKEYVLTKNAGEEIGLVEIYQDCWLPALKLVEDRVAVTTVELAQQ